MKKVGQDILLSVVKSALGALSGYYALKGVKAAENFKKMKEELKTAE